MASISLIDQASMELAQRFDRADLHGQLKAMRAALAVLLNGRISVNYICAAAGIHPDPVCIMHWISEHDPEIAAFRLRNYPNMPLRLEGIYV